LGVSELVTNAVIHAGSHIRVALVGDPDDLRIEVFDEAPGVPVPLHPGHFPAQAGPAAVGRGLRIVDAISTEWGVRNNPSGGKSVWFKPSPTETSDPAGNGHENRTDAATDEPGPSSTNPGNPGTDLVAVEIIDLPVQVFVSSRVRYQELMREMTLIAMESREPGTPGTVAHRLVDLAQELEAFRGTGS
jgi:hypothetical protein